MSKMEDSLYLPVCHLPFIDQLSLRSPSILIRFYSTIMSSLVGNNIGSVGAHALALMLEKNKSLEELW